MIKLPKKSAKQYWDKFATTGRIEDYLNYKFTKKKEEAYEASDKEKGNHPKHLKTIRIILNY